MKLNYLVIPLPLTQHLSFFYSLWWKVFGLVEFMCSSQKNETVIHLCFFGIFIFCSFGSAVLCVPQYINCKNSLKFRFFSTQATDLQPQDPSGLVSVTVVTFAGVVVFVIVLVVALLFFFSSWSSLSRLMLTNFPQYCEDVFFFCTYPFTRFGFTTITSGI